MFDGVRGLVICVIPLRALVAQESMVIGSGASNSSSC